MLAQVRILTKGNVQQSHYVHADAWDALSDLLILRVAPNDPNGRAPLFRSRAGGVWNDKTIRRIVHRWGVQAGVHACTPHRFRHTFATNLVDLGVDIRVIQLLLGHASIQSTMIYTKVSDHRRAGAVMRLPSFKTIDHDYRPVREVADTMPSDATPNSTETLPERGVQGGNGP